MSTTVELSGDHILRFNGDSFVPSPKNFTDEELIRHFEPSNKTLIRDAHGKYYLLFVLNPMEELNVTLDQCLVAGVLDKKTISFSSKFGAAIVLTKAEKTDCFVDKYGVNFKVLETPTIVFSLGKTVFVSTNLEITTYKREKARSERMQLQDEKTRLQRKQCKQERKRQLKQARNFGI